MSLFGTSSGLSLFQAARLSSTSTRWLRWSWISSRKHGLFKNVSWVSLLLIYAQRGKVLMYLVSWDYGSTIRVEVSEKMEEHKDRIGLCPRQISSYHTSFPLPTTGDPECPIKPLYFELLICHVWMNWILTNSDSCYRLHVHNSHTQR